MPLNPHLVYDWATEHFIGKCGELLGQGYKLISLSMYGAGAGLRYAGVFDKRPGPAQGTILGHTLEHFNGAFKKAIADGLQPRMVAATAGGADMRISVVLEPRPVSGGTELSLEQDLGQLQFEIGRRAADGWVPISAAMYDDAAHEPRFAVVWRPNQENVAWSLEPNLSDEEFQDHFNVHWSGWARLAFATGSSRGRLLAIYRDDQLGPIGQGFVVRHRLDRPAFEKEHSTWLAKGFHTVCLQGYGTGEGRRFAAIFVNNEQPVARTIRMTGSPAVPAIDQAMIDFMKQSNIRGAALAVVDKTRLVLARGYTFAEPDYPDVQPTTCFRVASVSKLPAALGIHQLIAEGALTLSTPLATALPLTNPNGSTVTNAAYLAGTVGNILQPGGRFDRYEGRLVDVAATFGVPLPVTHPLIASFMMTQPLLPQPSTRLDDFGYFLAGQIIKRARGAATLMEALSERFLKPLGITRLRTARALLSAQPADEARYHSRTLALARSVMSSQRPLVPGGYGDEHLEMMETSGGLSGAVTDIARILAAMNVRPYTPLGRPAVESLILSAAANGANGHGFDWLEQFDANQGFFRGPKGGLLQSSQAGIWFESNGFCTVVAWNGLHTQGDLALEPGDAPGWYPRFDRVMDAAQKHSWPAGDLFPDYGMDPLPTTQEGWRWCVKCEGMFYAAAGKSVCPAGGGHDGSGSGHYHVMFNSSFPYGQNGWRYCKKCGGLHYGGFGPGVCPAGGGHDGGSSFDYRLVANSPYNEKQLGWRYCHRCQGSFFAGHPTKGRCPAGGAHDGTGSFDYSMAFTGP
jgi:CubicO group peptidase (beta-lactamase class C family)